MIPLNSLCRVFLNMKVQCGVLIDDEGLNENVELSPKITFDL
jgi:hypothetical protein